MEILINYFIDTFDDDGEEKKFFDAGSAAGFVLKDIYTLDVTGAECPGSR